MRLKINPLYEKYSNDPACIHYQIIKDSIRDNGQYNKIILNEKGEILDGHKRYKSCNELDITPRTEIKSFDTQEQEEEYVIDCNLARTHYTIYEKVEMCEILLPKIKEQAEKRQKAGKKLTFTQNYVKVNAHHYATDSILARKAGISATTYQKYRKIINSNDGQLKDDVKNKKISVTKACNILKKYSQQKTQNQIPKIKHSIVVASPKWVVREGSSINVNHYPYIIKSCSDENAVLVLCVNNKHVPDAIDLVRNSDFDYQSLHTEHGKKLIIVAKRGKITLPDLKFDSKQDICKVIENAFPSQKYVGLWTKQYSDKWTVWDETRIESISEHIPEWRRPTQSKLAEHHEDFGRFNS